MRARLRCVGQHLTKYYGKPERIKCCSSYSIAVATQYESDRRRNPTALLDCHSTTLRRAKKSADTGAEQLRTTETTLPEGIMLPGCSGACHSIIPKTVTVLCSRYARSKYCLRTRIAGDQA